MQEKIGNIIYFVACMMAAFFMYRYMPSIRGAIPAPMEKVAFAVAGTTIIWGVGWVIRYFLTANTSTKL